MSRSRRIVLWGLYGILAILLGTIAWLVYEGYIKPQQEKASIKVVWEDKNPTVSAKDQERILSILRDKLALVERNGKKVFVGNTFTIKGIYRQDDWIDIGIQVNDNPSPMNVLVHYQNGTWQIWIPGDKDFCKQIIRSTMPDSVKRYYIGCLQ